MHKEKQLSPQIHPQTQIQLPTGSGSQQHPQILAKTSAPVSNVAPAPSRSATQTPASTAKDVATSESFPTRLSPPTIIPITATPSLIPSNVPQKRPASTLQTQTTHEPGKVATAGEQNSKPVESQPVKSIATTREAESPSERPSSPVVSATPCPIANVHNSPPSILRLPSETIPPAAKRRRIEVAPTDGGPVQASGQNDVTVPTPSGISEGRITDAGDNTEARSRATEPEANPQPSKTRKPRLSEKAKGKQPMLRVAVGTDAAEGSSNETPKKRKARNLADKRRQSAAEDAATNIVAHAVQGSSAKKGAKHGRKAREPTPEGADAVMIVPSKVRMSELCKNTRTGKKSTRGKELEDLDKAEAVRKSQQELQGFLGTTGTSKDPSETAETRLERLSRVGEETAQMVPNTIIIDGEIHIDETSLQIDRHANAAAERDAEALEGIDESELTRRVNQNSWLKRDTGGRWDGASTERFFEALRMFGTDFDMISKLFPGRTRRSIKLKFVKEEKADPQRIKQVLLGERVLVDMDEYSRLTNTVYEDPQELEKDLAEDRERMEEEQRLAKEAIDEAARQREREVEAERAAGEQEEALERSKGKEIKVGKKRGRAKKKGNEISTTTTATTTTKE